jgi:hypothetical protein
VGLFLEMGKTGEEQICAGGNLQTPLRHLSLYCKKADENLHWRDKSEWNLKLWGWIMSLERLTQTTFRGLGEPEGGSNQVTEESAKAS